jgi:hypothetical protein
MGGIISNDAEEAVYYNDPEGRTVVHDHDGGHSLLHGHRHQHSHAHTHDHSHRHGDLVHAQSEPHDPTHSE